jgi:hypothetical protein
MDNAPALYSGIRELSPQGGHDRKARFSSPRISLCADGAGHFRARRSDGDAGMMLVLPLTEGLLRQAIANERDRVTRELCDYPQFISAGAAEARQGLGAGGSRRAAWWRLA